MRIFEQLKQSTLLLLPVVSALRYDPEQVGFNLNENETATDPMDYWGEWKDHSYHPSPQNWRVPFYTLFLDRFVNGNPTNDDANGTQFEHDLMSNRFRHGGDVLGLVDSFDYLQGMGVKALYIAGVPHVNEPWLSDGYSPLDLTLLDRHFGNISDWRKMVSEAHRRGIYIVLDNTVATMGDLIGFRGFLSTAASLNPHEYDYIWKGPRRYHDFQPGNSWLDKCEYPRFWADEANGLVNTTLVDGCRDSEFDQYGETASYGNYSQWERQITKFAFVQDRLREWRTDVRKKIERFSCITIAMLDIDGFRIDKALDITLDAQGEWSNSIRHCARRFGKNNFYIPGEIVSGNSYGALYIGRGRQRNQTVTNMTEAVTMTNKSSPELHLRAPEKAALDGAAFHYSLYRALTRFLGLDGIYESDGDPPADFVELWNIIIQTNDMVNANTGKFDPRHLYGASNHDVFRWPAIKDGIKRQNLALYIIALLMPGAPLLIWGEEQAFYVLESSNANYLFGRSPMSSTQAWQLHGCYKVGSDKYHNFPLDRALQGCLDDNVSLDHRDPSHPIRGLVKTMFEARQNYPALNDGFYLQQLSNKTHSIYLPGSNGTRTELGMWSVLRSHFAGVQDFSGLGQGNQSVWLVYQNENHTVDYKFDCFSKDALISPFDEGTTVKNLFPPFEEYTLRKSSKKIGLDGSKRWNGCISDLTLYPWGFKAFVPKKTFVPPSPFITHFMPGHDQRIHSIVTIGERLKIGFQFSQEMDCNSITKSLSVKSTAYGNQDAKLDESTISCGLIPESQVATWNGALSSVYAYSIELTNVFHGVHEIIVHNVSNKNGNQTTNSVDHFIFRIGSMENPMVWPKQANYSRTLLRSDPSKNGSLWVSHKAAGADKWRYTLDFGSSYSEWMPYKGGNESIPRKNWTGTEAQSWKGEHIMVQYWNRITGSSDHYQHGDTGWDNMPPRRFPHFWVQGSFNLFGYNSGYRSKMTQNSRTGQWEYNLMAEWPVSIVLNAWGMDANGQSDRTQVYGDIDSDGVLDRVPPKTLLANFINISHPPPEPYLSYKVSFDDGNLRYFTTPIGSRWVQLALYLLLGLIPPMTGMIAVWIYLKAFYQIKLNKIGVFERKSFLALQIGKTFSRLSDSRPNCNHKSNTVRCCLSFLLPWFTKFLRNASDQHPVSALDTVVDDTRNTVLIATIEYDIEDWGIKIKIGGLGVMAQLMGANLSHQDLIWVVPCVGDIDYPEDERAEPMQVTILGRTYQVKVQYHVLRNITYVLLDAPIFRAQTKAQPYPVRMDDLNSAIYYSAWNSCIAEALKRFCVDIYHINDYHGALAPLHLLPKTIPCCLSLHNAEFQGLWPMRTVKECDEVCQVFNIQPAIVKRYVQFGDIFNLLHAAASYLHIHQNGFGAVGVSKKYGKRSYARYPIFWGLKEIGSLPNPDPSDTADWTRSEYNGEVQVDLSFEAGRACLKRQAQEWTGLDQNPNAELFVFVGRWSMQKGIDLIADVFPSILENHPEVQLICVGPVIDLYGKFAAIKLRKMMSLYPGRVYSRPEFTALPPFIFSGAEFALIPSRDEPFGLVAVEFGRKGALGVGSRVGGLGQMPGWWYTIESMTTKHLIQQFKLAIHRALSSTTTTRTIMRARSGRQRFPVLQWVQDLNNLQLMAIEKHMKCSIRGNHRSWIEEAGHISQKVSRRFIKHKEPKGKNRLNNRNNSQNTTNMFASGGASWADESDFYSPNGIQLMDRAQTRTLDRDCPLRAEGREHYLTSDLEDPNISPALLRDDVCSLPASSAGPSFGVHTPSSSRTCTGTGSEGNLLDPPSPSSTLSRQRETMSLLSVESITKEKQDYNLQRVSPFFTDSSKEYARIFERKLDRLNGRNSDSQLCIEEYISKSEKDWFNRYRDVRLGKSSSSSSPASSIFGMKMSQSSSQTSTLVASIDEEKNWSEFLLPKDYIPPSGLKRLLLRRIGDWPLYSILLGLGQIIAANSYQITLLNGEIGEPAKKLYIVATIYLFSSILWWAMYRLSRAIFVLSIPFFFYGNAFLFIGLSPLVRAGVGRFWMQNMATGFYTFASSSGSIFFALNFGDDGGAPIISWAYRACIIQGTQQIYITLLWYWGTSMAASTQAGSTKSGLADSNPYLLLGTGMGIAILLWLIGVLIFCGLPDYYRQAPGRVPAFYQTLLRRKIVMWFFYTVIIQNYFLSAPYGRNWLYLWSSQHAKTWHIVLLVLLFFIVVWVVFLWVFGVLSKRHAWFIPIFAIGLGAPRWCQMLWSLSNIGTYVPWAGGPVASALVGRVLWLWLGVLDALQGVGFGMILLNTLTRFHIAFTLLAAQVVGSIVTIMARATAPDKIGPGDVFPDFSADVLPGLSKASFWICIFLMLSVNVLCFMFFRKGQLQKP